MVKSFLLRTHLGDIQKGVQGCEIQQMRIKDIKKV